MARKRVSRGSVIIKKEEKLKAVFNEIKKEINEENFKNKFKEMFPEAWDRIIRKYNEYEKITKPNKSHPMPEPDRYLSNLYKTNIEKYKSS